jgi:ketosteroid isomerase-like protein
MNELIASALSGTILILAAVAAIPGAARAAVSEPLRIAENYSDANEALMRGDAKTWQELAPLSDDFLLFSPFGGKPSRSSDYSPDKFERMSRFFRNGRHQQEVLQIYATGDLVVVAAIERDDVEVGGLPPQRWSLRMTSVFKRDGQRWLLAHRHADPFVEDVPIEQAARLARGERDRPSQP